MKKFLKCMFSLLVCSVLFVMLAACGGYDVEGLVSYGEEGDRLFFGVSRNKTYSKSEGVTVAVNFAHEKTSDEETAYLIYTYVSKDGTTSIKSFYSLPLEFSQSEYYNAKNVTREEVLPGRYAYSCTFPQSAVTLELPVELFSGESGSVSLVLAERGVDVYDQMPNLTYTLSYTVDGDTITIA